VREPRPYDPKLVTKREAARLDRTRRFRTPLFDRVFAERLWLHPQISRARPLINPLQGGRNLAIIEGPAPNRPGNENPARRQPSREKPFWSEAHKIVRKWLQDEGCPASGDGNQAALERHIAQWLSEHGHMAGEATIRRHVFRWIAERRRELGV
jgi:hypothetical protein